MEEFGRYGLNILQDRRLNCSELRLYLYLKFRQGKNHLCYPSYQKIHEDLGLSMGGISKLLANLEKYKWIEIKRRYYSSNIYVVLDQPVTADFYNKKRKGNTKLPKLTKGENAVTRRNRAENITLFKKN